MLPKEKWTGTNYVIVCVIVYILHDFRQLHESLSVGGDQSRLSSNYSAKPASPGRPEIDSTSYCFT